MDCNKLRKKMDGAKVKVEHIAEALIADRSTVYRRLKGEGKKFTIEEAVKIAILLGLTPQDCVEIFFDELVADVRLEAV